MIVESTEQIGKSLKLSASFDCSVPCRDSTFLGEILRSLCFWSKYTDSTLKSYRPPESHKSPSICECTHTHARLSAAKRDPLSEFRNFYRNFSITQREHEIKSAFANSGCQTEMRQHKSFFYWNCSRWCKKLDPKSLEKAFCRRAQTGRKVYDDGSCRTIPRCTRRVGVGVWHSDHFYLRSRIALVPYGDAHKCGGIRKEPPARREI